MGWVKPSGPGVLIANWDSAARFLGTTGCNSDRTNVELRFSPAGDGSYLHAFNFNPNWSTNDWHHVAVSYAAARMWPCSWTENGGPARS